ncbi:MAG: lipoprotein, partial [Acidimicrobiia bacterium]
MRKPLLILVALLVVAGGIAYAAIPGADGTISGCYRT